MIEFFTTGSLLLPVVLLLLALPGGSAFVKHHNFSAELPRWHWHTHDEVGEAVASLAGNHSLGMHLPQENHELLVHGMTQAISALRSADTALHTFREEAAPDGEAVPPEAVAHAHVMLELRHLEGNQARHGVLSKQQVGHEAFFKGAGKAVLGVLKTVWKQVSDPMVSLFKDSPLGMPELQTDMKITEGFTIGQLFAPSGAGGTSFLEVREQQCDAASAQADQAACKSASAKCQWDDKVGGCAGPNVHGSFDVKIPGLHKLWSKMLTSAPVRAFNAVVAVLGKLVNVLKAGLDAIKKVVKAAFDIAKRVLDAVMGFIGDAFAKLGAAFDQLEGKFCLSWERLEEMKRKPLMDSSFPSIEVGELEIANAKKKDPNHDWEQFRGQLKVWPTCGERSEELKHLKLPKPQMKNLMDHHVVRQEYSCMSTELGGTGSWGPGSDGQGICKDLVGSSKSNTIEKAAKRADVVCGSAGGLHCTNDYNAMTGGCTKFKAECSLLRAPPECCDEMLKIASKYAFDEYDEKMWPGSMWGINHEIKYGLARSLKGNVWRSTFYCWMATMTARDERDMPPECLLMRDERKYRKVSMTHDNARDHTILGDYHLDMVAKVSMQNVASDMVPDEKGYSKKCDMCLHGEGLHEERIQKCYKDKTNIVRWNTMSSEAIFGGCPKPEPTCEKNCWPKMDESRVSEKCRAAAATTPMEWTRQAKGLLNSAMESGGRGYRTMDACRCGYWGWAIKENHRRLEMKNKDANYELRSVTVPAFKVYRDCMGNSEARAKLVKLMGNNDRMRQQQEDTIKKAMPRSLDDAAAMTSKAQQGSGTSGVGGVVDAAALDVPLPTILTADQNPFNPATYAKAHPELGGRCEGTMKKRLRCPTDAGKKDGLHMHFQADSRGFTAMVCWLGRPITHTCFSWAAPPCIVIPIDPVAMLTLNICPSNLMDVECGESNMLGVLDVRLSVGLRAYGLKKLSFDAVRAPVWPKIMEFMPGSTVTQKSCHLKSKPEEVLNQPFSLLGVTLAGVETIDVSQEELEKAADELTGPDGEKISDAYGIDLDDVKPGGQQ